PDPHGPNPDSPRTIAVPPAGCRAPSPADPATPIGQVRSTLAPPARPAPRRTEHAGAKWPPPPHRPPDIPVHIRGSSPASRTAAHRPDVLPAAAGSGPPANQFRREYRPAGPHLPGRPPLPPPNRTLRRRPTTSGRAVSPPPPAGRSST